MNQAITMAWSVFPQDLRYRALQPIVDGLKPLTIVAKHFILDVWGILTTFLKTVSQI